MESKYYTPKLNEFFDGFEYESLDLLWSKTTFEYRDLDVIDDEIREGTIRVKFLTIEDVESLGWTHDINIFTSFIQLENGHTYNISGVYGREHDFVSIAEIIKTGAVRFVFHGIIKNKSELEKLMVQLCITKK